MRACRAFFRSVGRVDRRWPSARSLGVASPRRRRVEVSPWTIRFDVLSIDRSVAGRRSIVQSSLRCFRRVVVSFSQAINPQPPRCVARIPPSSSFVCSDDILPTNAHVAFRRRVRINVHAVQGHAADRAWTFGHSEVRWTCSGDLS